MPEALIALDIDNCLMPVNQPAAESTRQLLLRLAAAGGRIVYASGKPCAYLSGLARGLGTMEAALIGENGAETWLHSTMPTRVLRPELREEELAALEAIRAEVARQFGDRVFFQPNRVGVTAFPFGELTPDAIAAHVEATVGWPEGLICYRHVDSADWAVKRVNKGDALLRLAGELGVPQHRLAAAGDSANDLPMLAVVDLAVWVGRPEALGDTPAEVFPDIDAALTRVLDWLAA